MADEKKIEGEILSEAELDGVAGGSQTQNETDLRFMREIGVITGDFASDKTVRGWQLKESWAKVGVVILADENISNAYYDSKGKEISRGDAYKIAAKKMHSKIDYTGYLKCN